MTTGEMAHVAPLIFFLWCFEITALLCSYWTVYEVFQLRVTDQ